MEPIMLAGDTYTEDSPIIHFTTTEAQTRLTEIVQQVAAEDQPVILNHNGENLAAIISLEAFEFLERMIEKLEDEIDIATIHEDRKNPEKELNITLEKLKQELGF